MESISCTKSIKMLDQRTKKHTSERAVLIGLITLTQTKEQAIEYLEQLTFLANTAGANPVKYFLQKLSYADPKTFITPSFVLIQLVVDVL